MPAGGNGAYGFGAGVRGHIGDTNTRLAVSGPGVWLGQKILPAVNDFAKGLLGMSPAAAAAPAAPAAQAAQQQAIARPNVYDPLGPAGEAAKGPDMSFAGLVARAAKTNGGKITVDQLDRLSEIAYRTEPRQKQLSPKDMATTKYMELTEGMLQRSMAEIEAGVAAGKLDPVSAQEMSKNAWMKYKQDIAPVVGVDPQEAAIAERLTRLQQGE